MWNRLTSEMQTIHRYNREQKSSSTDFLLNAPKYFAQFESISLKDDVSR